MTKGENGMDTKVLIELIGYLGSALVVVSMLMTSVVRLRVVNTIGSAIFMGYALVIGSYPTAVMNFFLIAINVWHLVHLLRNQKAYDLIDVCLEDSFVAYFLTKNMQDIRTFFPDFSRFLISPENKSRRYQINTERGGKGSRHLFGQILQRGFAEPVYGMPGIAVRCARITDRDDPFG